jgi:hypothetical protein
MSADHWKFWSRWLRPSRQFYVKIGGRGARRRLMGAGYRAAVLVEEEWYDAQLVGH